MPERNDEYREVEEFTDTYVEHGINGLAAFHGILEYAQYIDKINYKRKEYYIYRTWNCNNMHFSIFIWPWYINVF